MQAGELRRKKIYKLKNVTFTIYVNLQEINSCNQNEHEEIIIYTKKKTMHIKK